MSRLAEPSRHPESNSIGAAAIFALVIIVCMAVLAVLTAATAHSSLVLSERQAAAMQNLYRTEATAQTFLAQVDRVLSDEGTGGLAAALPGICRSVTAESAAADSDGTGDGQVQASAALSGNTLTAEFRSPDGRVLKVTLALTDDGTYRIEAWRMTAVVHDEEPLGILFQE